MTLTELRYLVALSETGHFRKAAERCHVSQPTLSLAIKRLEGELGLSLFERARGQLTATPVGEQIIRQARRVLEESAQLRELADLGRDPLRGTLSVGAIYTVGPYLFPRLVGNLHRFAPAMPLFIEESYTAVLRRKLRAGLLDAIFVALPFTETDVVTRTLYQEPLVVVMPEEHPLAGDATVDPKALADHRVLLLGEGHCFRDQVLSTCPGLQRQLDDERTLGQAVVEGGSLETLKHMVASGLGITVLPRSAASTAEYGTQRLLVRPFDEPQPTREVALAWRASFPRHQAIDALGRAVQERSS